MLQYIIKNADTIKTLADISTGIGVLFALAGLIFSLISFIANAKGEKKRETIIFFRDVTDKCNVLLNKITEEFKGHGIIGYKEANEKPDIFKAIRGYLSIMEEFSVGINNKVFDINIFEKTAGVHSRIWHARFKKIIDGIRDEEKRPTLFTEFEKMVGKIKERQEKKGYTDDWLNALINKPQENTPAKGEPIEYTPEEREAIVKLGFENRNYIFTHTTETK